TGLVVPCGGLDHAVQVFGVHGPHPQGGVLAPVLRGVAEHGLDLRADVHGGGQLVHEVDVGDRRDCLDQGPVPRLGLQEAFLGLLALGDVHEDALPDVPQTLAIPLHHHGLVANPHDPAVLGHHSIIHDAATALVAA